MDIQVTTRPVRPDDDQRLVRMWPRLSADTVYRRFHAPLRRLPMATVRHLVEVDHELREAVVAEIGDEVVGVARYDRSPADPSGADFAVVVEDAWQGLGLGRQLLVELTGLAARRGVRRLTATVQMDNDRMLRPGPSAAARLPLHPRLRRLHRREPDTCGGEPTPVHRRARLTRTHPRETTMSRFGTALRRRRDLRASLRTELAVRRAMAGAPTAESAHEIASAATRR